MSGTESESRMGFMRDVLRCCSLDDLGIVLKLVNTAQKRARDKPRLAQKLERAKKFQCSSIPASVSSVPVSEAEQREGYWWEEYDTSQIIAFDVEFVTLLQKDERGRHIQSPGTVSVVDFTGKPLFSVINALHKVKLVKFVVL